MAVAHHIDTYVSCPTQSMCAASISNDTFENSIAVSTNPTGGIGASDFTRFSSGLSGESTLFGGISCPTESLCVVTDYDHVWSSVNPTDQNSTWVRALAQPPGGLIDISCPTASLCAAVGFGGNVVTSRNPTGGEGEWAVASVNGAGTLLDISCPTESLCVAVDGEHVITSTNPTGGVGAWHAVSVNGINVLSGVSCPTESLCYLVDNQGKVVTSTEPTGGTGAWTGAPGITGSPTAISCPTESLCVAVDVSGSVIVGTPDEGQEGADEDGEGEGPGARSPVSPGPNTSNLPPLAACDVYRVPYDTTLRVPASNGLLSNDADPEGGAIRITAVKTSFARRQKAFLLNQMTGAFRFNPGPVQNPRSASIRYTIADPQGATSQGQVKIYIGPGTLPHKLGLLGCSSATNAAASDAFASIVPSIPRGPLPCYIQQLGRQGYRGSRPTVELRIQLWCIPSPQAVANGIRRLRSQVRYQLKRRFRKKGKVVLLARGQKVGRFNIRVSTNWVAPWHCRGRNRKKIRKQRRNIRLFVGLWYTHASANAPGWLPGHYGYRYPESFSLTCTKGDTIFRPFTLTHL